MTKITLEPLIKLKKMDTYDFKLQKYECIQPMTKNDRL